MPILKSGFTAGFRGRKKAPTWNRRAHYLSSEHDRDSALLVGCNGRSLTPSEATQTLGGAKVRYHEIVIAPSLQECRAIWEGCPDAPAKAAKETGMRLAKAYAQRRPSVLAIHEQDARYPALNSKLTNIEYNSWSTIPFRAAGRTRFSNY